MINYPITQLPNYLPPLLVLVGATAVGKTALSLQLAKQFDGEIISADSRLFYRGMDIGTAKPSLAERMAVPHHLIDICNPDETLSLGAYQKLAYATIDTVHGHGRLPLLVGGTGQYVKAVIEGWGIPAVAPQPALRAELARLGGAELARWLQLLDPEAAARLDPRNTRRVIRALEVTLVSGQPISVLQRKSPPPYTLQVIGLYWERAAHFARIDARVDEMMAAGLLGELEGLRAAGYGRDLPAMSGLGYQQLWAYLAGEMELDAAVERIKFETHRFARHQAAWFRRDDPTITWFDASQPDVGTAVSDHVAAWLFGE
ncbi:MAG TPA: tRNA (adenosine(37)-N6)-dimethylallyltransferase MiaA [Chloroflexota bacterium]|nr:tRNA (adenosine(37)-N6)-dimethylallyltransferase MiaA [Chloroflexota bacterium]